MIFDRIQNAELYHGLSKNLKYALKWINANDLVAMPAGRYVIDESLLAIVSEYQTKEIGDSVLEAHRRHIDVQYMIKGTEQIGYVPLINQNPVQPYNEEKDLLLFNDEVSFVKLETGMFAILFPTDIHRPSVKHIQQEQVKKVVIKVRID